jgi:nucleotide-binding universal stress UspA family protein
MTQGYQKIVVPLDGSGWADAAVPHAARIAKNNDAELILLHVYHSPLAQYQDTLALSTKEEFVDQEYESIKSHIIAIRNDVRAQGVKVRGHILYGRSPAYQIVKFVENEEVDLVVMSSHGRTGLARFVFGSVAQKVMQSLEVPVLIIRPDKPAEEMLDTTDLPSGEEL